MSVLATVISSNAALVANNIQISALAVSVYHYVLTLSAEYRFYRAFYRDNFRLNANLVQFILIRYTAVVATALGNWACFSHNFTLESCRRLFLLPTVFRVWCHKRYLACERTPFPARIRPWVLCCFLAIFVCPQCNGRRKYIIMFLCLSMELVKRQPCNPLCFSPLGCSTVPQCCTISSP